MSALSRRNLALFALAAVACLGCDQLTKDMARTHLAERPPALLAWGTVELVFTENPGAFLSLGAELPRSVRQAIFGVGTPLLLAALCVGLLRQAPQRHEVLALALLVGGGVGNWLDRLLRDGAVTDFVRVGLGPLRTGIFNLADVAILAGAGLLLLASLRGAGQAEPPEQPS